MGKKIYINEGVANAIIDNSRPMKTIPNDIKKALRNHNTSLGQHPCFPPEEEIPFDEKVCLQRYTEIKKDISHLNLENYSEEEISNRLSKLLTECKEIEKPFIDKLEKLCYNYIIDMFQVPEGYVSFSCNIVDKVNDDNAPLSDKPEDFSFLNIKHMSRLSDEVYKRRLIDSLITGAAIRLSKISKELIGELYEMDPSLPALYKEFNILNDYLLFTRNKLNLTDGKKKQIGISYLTIGNDVTKNKIEAEGEIFPVLLYESIKGFMEMFAVYGLPKNKKEATYVMEKADFIDAEPWDMRLGPVLWDILIDTLNFPDTEDLPSILILIFGQSPKKFNTIMQEFFGLTDYGKKLSEKIIKKISSEMEYDIFADTMAKKNLDKTLMSDEYFSPEELED